MEIKEILHRLKLHLKYRFVMEFASFQGELMPEEALTAFTVSDAYR